MKVICKCCHRSFDYDMYMGLCPKCGRVYRRGREAYSPVERDMAGEFHVHADARGLNRGIDGVVYNQSSDNVGVMKTNSDVISSQPVYTFSPNHKTKINQSLTKNMKNSTSSALFVGFMILVYVVYKILLMIAD